MITQTRYHSSKNDCFIDYLGQSIIFSSDSQWTPINFFHSRAVNNPLQAQVGNMKNWYPPSEFYYRKE